MIKTIVFTLVAATVSLSHTGEELFSEGDFENGNPPVRLCAPAGHFEFAVIREASGNHCAMMRIRKTHIDAKTGKHAINGSILAGRVKGRYGNDGCEAIKIKPDTRYEIRFSCKGNVNKLYLRAYCWKNAAKDRKDRIEHKYKSPIIPASEWQEYVWEVKTDTETKTMAVDFQVWTEGKQGSLTETTGNILMIDNISIREK
ncbi:MAG: hypothetical protein JXR78_13935 [Victivallales bacterium]|nr:hypothetical protein [Victivallales bacterium]